MLGRTSPDDKKESLENWRNAIGHEQADEITNEACRHGTAVHALMEHHFVGTDISDVDISEEDEYIFRSMRFLIKPITDVVAAEVALYSDDLDVAGRCDMIASYNGKKSIIDYKTSRRHKTDHDIQDYWVQTCFYALAYNQMYNQNINHLVILMGTRDGVPMKWERDIDDELIEQLIDRVDRFYQNFLEQNS